MMRTRRLHERLSYVVRVDDRVSVAHVAATLAAHGSEPSARYRDLRLEQKSRK